MATIQVIYHSDTGNTQRLAEFVAELPAQGASQS